MISWLPVIATLSGAIVAGAISLLVSWLSNRHSLQHAKLAQCEDRAKWATERRLNGLKNFYTGIESLLDATQQFRIQQAWAASEKKDGIKAPNWVRPYNDARQAFENTIHGLFLECCLLESEIEQEFEKIREHEFNWFCSKTDDDGVQALVAMERDLMSFRKSIAERYRTTFKQRQNGTDLLT